MTLVEELPTFIGSTTEEEFRAAYRAVPCVWFRQVRKITTDTTITGKNKADNGVNGNGSYAGDDSNHASRKRKRSDNRHCHQDSTSDSRGNTDNNDPRGREFVKIILDTFQAATTQDKKSWSVENTDVPVSSDNSSSAMAASEFLSPTSTQNGYCSFVLQDNSNESVTNFTQEHVEFPSLPLCWTSMESTKGSGRSPVHATNDTNDTGHKEGLVEDCQDSSQNEDTDAATNGASPVAGKGQIVYGSNNVAALSEIKNCNRSNSGQNGGDSITKESHAQNKCIFISDPYWLFVGRNTSPTPIMGRTEHTDGILHDGTFHFQVVGRKTWKLRPTSELRTMCDEDYDLALKDSYVITVEEGDIFVINTRLWWHQTELPGLVSPEPVLVPPTDSNGTTTRREALKEVSSSGLSISYARDMYFDGRQPEEGESEYMSSMDGAWATGFIPQGTVLFTEKDPPIRRLNDPDKTNCEMFEVEDEEGGIQLAVVASKDIEEGDFFLIHDDDADDDADSDAEDDADDEPKD